MVYDMWYMVYGIWYMCIAVSQQYLGIWVGGGVATTVLIIHSWNGISQHPPKTIGWEVNSLPDAASKFSL